ncbi:unnamed protein product [Prorocentrum cordatum]|uniref:Uncharacterized protein n=1 Tax=Prorocentrum cordatum TaxID=2364126 RepID=A0ABN9RDU6_9DINO|nr:unnamed protein product [Polarella glacialis]
MAAAAVQPRLSGAGTHEVAVLGRRPRRAPGVPPPAAPVLRSAAHLRRGGVEVAPAGATASAAAARLAPAAPVELRLVVDATEPCKVLVLRQDGSKFGEASLSAGPRQRCSVALSLEAPAAAPPRGGGRPTPLVVELRPAAPAAPSEAGRVLGEASHLALRHAGGAWCAEVALTRSCFWPPPLAPAAASTTLFGGSCSMPTVLERAVAQRNHAQYACRTVLTIPLRTCHRVDVCGVRVAAESTRTEGGARCAGRRPRTCCGSRGGPEVHEI